MLTFLYIWGIIAGTPTKTWQTITLSAIDYKFDDGSLWLSVHHSSLSSSNPNFSNPSRTAKSEFWNHNINRYTKVSMLELMHQEQTNSSIS
jgi:hypothetical protein